MRVLKSIAASAISSSSVICGPLPIGSEFLHAFPMWLIASSRSGSGLRTFAGDHNIWTVAESFEALLFSLQSQPI